MNNKVIFFTGCIGSRFLLSLITKKYTKYKWISSITFIIGFSFLFIYIFDLRKTGFEATNNKIWWNKYRPIHGLCYMLFSIFYFNNNKQAWIFLLIDTILGILIYINKFKILKIY